MRLAQKIPAEVNDQKNKLERERENSCLPEFAGSVPKEKLSDDKRNEAPLKGDCCGFYEAFLHRNIMTEDNRVYKQWTTPGYLGDFFIIETETTEHILGRFCYLSYLVPRRGLEPPRIAPLPPQGSAFTNYATWALLCQCFTKDFPTIRNARSIFNLFLERHSDAL